MIRVSRAALLLLVGLVAYALMLEGYARIKHGPVLQFKSTEMAYRQADFEFGHTLIPNSTGYSSTREWRVPYYVNSFGLRDREYPLEKPDHTVR